MPFAAANNAYVCGRYTLLAKLGAGGQGEVWRARDHEQGLEIALKILSPELARTAGAWEALQREYSIASRLDHPLILKVYHPERDADLIALPMELAPGGDLRRLRTVSYLEIGPVLLEIAQALEHTHERGIVHRDLKPGNVLFDARGHVRLADFGIAGTVLGAVAPPGDLARAGLSPFTASPEQLRGEPPTVADDIYGLGALAYELLSGYPPFYPRFELKRVLEEPVPQLKPAHQAPGRLIALVMAMLAKRADQRPASMRSVIDSLEATLNDTLTFDDPEEPVRDEEPEGRREPREPEGAAEPDMPAERAERGEFAVLQPRPAAPAVHNVTVVDSEAMPMPELRTPRTRAESLRQPEAGASRRVVRPIEIVPPTPTPTAAATAAPSYAPTSARRASPLTSRFAAPPAYEPATAMKATRAEQPRDQDLRELWADIKVERVSPPARAEPGRRARWPWVLIVTLAAAAAASFFWLPRWAAAARAWAPSSLASLERLVPENVVQTVERVVEVPLRAIESAAGRSDRSTSTADGESPASAATTEDSVSAARARFEARLAALDARGAGVWGGQAYADAKARGAEAVGADEAGSSSMAAQKLVEAERLLGQVEQSAPGALAAQLSQGEQALRAGNGAAARQAFELAHRIDPHDSQASDGLQRAQALDGALPLLVDGLNAEAGRNYSRAVQDYRRLLSLDPGDAKARAGLRRASAGLGAQRYDRAVGLGLESLADGRLQAARDAFELAYSMNPRAREAVDGLQRVSTAIRARELTQLQSRATALEAQQRWGEALVQYDAALRLDPSLSFAQQGRARIAGRADLASRIQALVDDPQSLTSPAVRQEALALVKQADGTQPSSADLQSLAAQLSTLVPEYDRTVHLALVSDNVTEVEIPQIGSFGTFSRREIDLKPGKYTVIGTRAGYRDVRRDVTISPGQEIQTISVRCEEPI